MIVEASTGRRICVLTFCMCIQAIYAGLLVSFSIMFAEIVLVFEAKRAEAVVMQGLFSGISCAAGIFVQPIITKYGPGPSTAVGAIICSIGLSLNFFVSSVGMIIFLAGVVSSVGISFTLLSSHVCVSWIFHNNAGAALVALTNGLSIGDVSFSYLGNIIIEQFQWNGAFLLLGAIVLHCVPAAVVMYTCRDYYKESNMTDSGLNKKEYSMLDVSIFRDVGISLTLMNAFLTYLTGNTEQYFFVDALTSRGFERRQGALVLTVIAVGKLIGRVLGSVIEFKSKFPTIYHLVYLCPLLAVGHILSIQIRDLNTLYGALVVYGILFGIVDSLWSAILFEVAGLDKYPQALVWFSIITGIGNILCNFLGGVIKDVYGEYDPIFYFAAAVSLVMSATSLYLSFLNKRRIQRMNNDEYELILSK